MTVATFLIWLPNRPRVAALVGGVTLSLGFTLGWFQQMRGAHFLSHTLWSIWIAICFVTTLYTFFIALPNGALKISKQVP